MTPRKYRMNNRDEAVEETRQRILQSAMVLHGEQGILQTSWKDIAERADVSLATVYRHFPSLDELLPACGEKAYAYIQAPDPKEAHAVLASIPLLNDRVARLVQEFCSFYQRAAPVLESVRRQSHQLPHLEQWLAKLDFERGIWVREALSPWNFSGQAVQVVVGLLDSRTWQSLVEQGVADIHVSDLFINLLSCYLSNQQEGNEK